MSLIPCLVSMTSVARPSSGFALRETNPAFSSRSMRLVMLPDEIMASSYSAVGVSA
ncbi:hypothetical protein D3C86_1852680 [compost metagenome]